MREETTQKTVKRHYSASPQRAVTVGGRQILLDSEGYLCRLDDWSEEFAVALAKDEGLVLTDEHWEVIRYLRDYYRDHAVQAQVRAMIRHFTSSVGAGARQQPLPARDLPARRPAETGQSPRRPAAHQGRTLAAGQP